MELIEIDRATLVFWMKFLFQMEVMDQIYYNYSRKDDFVRFNWVLSFVSFM